MKEQQALFQLLKDGITPFHTVESCEKRLKEAGFASLAYDSKWNLEKG